MLPGVEFALILVVVVVAVAVTAGVADVVVVEATDDALAKPRFFNEPIEPFKRSGLSTSGPPNSCNCCSQQHNIASIPSSTCHRK